VSAIHDYVVRLLSLVDPAKRIGTMIIDLLDWLASVPGLDEIGVGPAHFIDSGMGDDVEPDDPTGGGLRPRSRHRWAGPGGGLGGAGRRPGRAAGHRRPCRGGCGCRGGRHAFVLRARGWRRHPRRTVPRDPAHTTAAAALVEREVLVELAGAVEGTHGRNRARS